MSTNYNAWADPYKGCEKGCTHDLTSGMCVDMITNPEREYDHPLDDEFTNIILRAKGRNKEQKVSLVDLMPGGRWMR